MYAKTKESRQRGEREKRGEGERKNKTGLQRYNAAGDHASIAKKVKFPLPQKMDCTLVSKTRFFENASLNSALVGARERRRGR